VQVEALEGVSGAFLLPDNPMGRIAPSSLAMAAYVATQTKRVVFACLSARDCSPNRFRQDLWTAAIDHTDHLLLVHGDRVSGASPSELTASQMLTATREACDPHGIDQLPPFHICVAAEVGKPLDEWKCGAESLFVQVIPSIDELAQWRSALGFKGKVFVGVLVLASAAMARVVNRDAPGITIPEVVISALERDPHCGVELAYNQIVEIERTGQFDGVHLVPVSRYREIAWLLSDRALVTT
jgi:5,10-methylenetetrahydrofolate reductase